TRSVMALSVACARCHDHKFDPIPTADYYAMVGIFRSTEVLGGVQPGNNKTGYTGEYVHLTSTSKRNGASADERKHHAELEAELETAKAKFEKMRTAIKQA